MFPNLDVEIYPHLRPDFLGSDGRSDVIIVMGLFAFPGQYAGLITKFRLNFTPSSLLTVDNGSSTRKPNTLLIDNGFRGSQRSFNGLYSRLDQATYRFCTYSSIFIFKFNAGF